FADYVFTHSMVIRTHIPCEHSFFIPLNQVLLRSTLFPYTTLFRSYIYVTSAHDTTSNQHQGCGPALRPPRRDHAASGRAQHRYRDRKSTRLNSSHVKISYAVYRSKKKNPKNDRNVAIHS